MDRSGVSRIFPVVVIIFVIAIVIVAVFSFGRTFFSGDSNNNAQSELETNQAALLNINADRSVRMTVRGPIVANENFRSYTITITPNDRTIVTYSGYLDQVIETKQLGNNTPAYEQFVFALSRANMMRGTAMTEQSNDTRGICAGGRIHEFAILSSYQVDKSLWSSSCKGSPGSLKADTSQLESLFLDQIPDVDSVLETIKL